MQPLQNTEPRIDTNELESNALIVPMLQRGSAAKDAMRPVPLERYKRRSHGDRGNDMQTLQNTEPRIDTNKLESNALIAPMLQRGNAAKDALRLAPLER